MIFSIFFSFVNNVLAVVLSVLPIANRIPLVDGYLVTATSYVYYLIAYFPPLGILLTGFISVLSWKFAMWVLVQVRIIKNSV